MLRVDRGRLFVMHPEACAWRFPGLHGNLRGKPVSSLADVMMWSVEL